MENNPQKKLLLDVIDFIKYQLIAGNCTDEEINSWQKAIAENVEIDASIKDIADFYGKTETDVSNTINRKYVGKPKRRVYYNFNLFNKIKPANWKHKSDK